MAGEVRPGRRLLSATVALAAAAYAAGLKTGRRRAQVAHRRNAEAVSTASAGSNNKPMARTQAGTGPGAPRLRRTGDVVLICDGTLHCGYASPATLPLLGRRSELLNGQPLIDLVHPDDKPALTGFAQHRGPGEVATMPIRFRHEDGHWVALEATTIGTADDDASVDFAALEVGERVRLEDWLATQRMVTDEVVSMATDAIVSTDGAGELVEWNRAAESTFGWTREEALGREVAGLLVPDNLRDEYRTAMHDLWASGSARVDEPQPATLMRRDGRELLTEVTAWSVQVGHTWRFTTLIRDVTARKEMEYALTEARRESDEASRLKSEFLAMVSHEIRTPMNGVIGLADVLLGTRLDDTQRRYAEGIRTAGAALLTVINDILDFSKADAGKIVLDETPFDLAELVEGVVDIVAGRARDKGLELVGFVRPDVPVALLGDPGRLRQVLLNLCANAVKFTAEGEVTVTVNQTESTMDGPAEDEPAVPLRVEVVDTGIGISPADQERMFDAFAQADASTTRRFGGTGLGLAISRRLVLAMGGQIGVDSEPGHGSTFWFEVALRRQPNSPPQQPARSDDLQGLRVLVVDDNATNRFVLESQLAEWQLVPSSVSDGREALALLRGEADQGRAFDVAILDLAMPTMDGLDLARQITADRAIPTVHMILLTSGPAIDVAAARRAGVSAWLTKPVHRSQLFDCLARMMTAPEPLPDPDSAAPAAQASESTPADHSAVSTPALAPADAGVAPPTRGHLLLAEDNEINQLVAVGILSAMGYQTDVVADGAAALDLAAEHSYDAILMDCQMPTLDGYGATAELRRRERSGEGPGTRTGVGTRTGDDAEPAHLPVIALTASARPEDRDRCLAAGMDDFVSKPIERDTLAEVLARWIPQANDRRAEHDGTGDEMNDHDVFAERGQAAIATAVAQRLDEIRGPDGQGQSLVLTLISSYLNRTPDDLEQLADAVATDDFPAIEIRAHRLRGGSANIGAAQLAERLSEVEAAAHEEHQDDARRLMDQLRDEYGEVRTVLEHELEPGSPAGAEG